MAASSPAVASKGVEALALAEGTAWQLVDAFLGEAGPLEQQTHGSR
jgi:hypothetical protein